ncbi:hypothetical protein E1287_08250 [Actinomadura sp. KC06]|uniref:hypothetical protein n=1 Tax=Actinomadura sp. KC06 TaxID=2530369 RepID=UPI00104477E2|nr:hypothetical protein [Actinomadura sp. KC06]TDD37555.1 hypothetical protein E1287_08250 [Actinomadura sp. KC06]
MSQNRAKVGLRQLFPDGDYYVVADDQELVDYAIELGARAIHLDQAAELPDGIGTAVFLRNTLVTRDIRRTFRKSRSFVIPISSFDSGMEVAKYTMRLVLLTDYEKACDYNRYWAKSVAEQPGDLIFYSDDMHLRCTLSEKLNANAWLDAAIDPGKWVSVGSYTEFSITAPSSKDWLGAFVLNGTLVAQGSLVAQDARADETGVARIREAWKVRDELVANAPITVELHEGRATSIRAGGHDFTDAVREVTNPDYNLHTLELGLGTNMSLLPHVDWRHNSQLNEGAGTVHLGFGEGMTGAHMDFVVADCSHKFEQTGKEVN